ncbi:hypothetical protein RBSWK_04987 [Rhodopirellula baltica SWK14]|uniref:Uncharacterized protein n=1 Tax=Rhodopirellula baltica SWK14 TaxID=993516 RepID=L7CA63_RHOBT|nr:hypothetical protein RBSWK_04987 [Rhodopirellula baltica SWK14]
MAIMQTVTTIQSVRFVRLRMRIQNRGQSCWSVGERLQSPGRDERFSIVTTPDFATRVYCVVRGFLGFYGDRNL